MTRSWIQRPETRKYVAYVLIFVAAYYAYNWLANTLDPSRTKRQETKAKSSRILEKLGAKNLKLTEYEQIIATEVIYADEIHVNFKQIGGLDHIIQDLRESVIYPLCYPDLFTSRSGLLGIPPGVLFYGPPGCGKTMMAKALAKESNATFINLHLSTLTDKYYGESNKLAAAVFSLAQKLQPAIVFIDEVDSFLRERQSNDHEVTGMMKAEFMSLWDGLTTGEDHRIVILGATNRPNDIDAAILRRMPKRFAIRLPTEAQRRSILELLLKDIKLSNTFEMEELVQRTEGCSGSDLKELCRNAAMIPVREIVRKEQPKESEDASQDLTHLDIKNIGEDLRPLTIADFYAFDEVNGSSSNVDGDRAPSQEISD